MKIAYISDIHIDSYIGETFNQKAINNFIINRLNPEDNKADILIIAGDTGHYNEQIIELVKQLREFYKNVLICGGNHELYITKDMYRKYNNSFDKLNILKEEINKIEGCYFGDGNDIIEINGIKFLGTIGWYDFSLGLKKGMTRERLIDLWKYSMNDAYYIKGDDYLGKEEEGYGIIPKYKYYTFDPFKYFEKEFIKLVANSEQADIIFTHIPPILTRGHFGEETDMFYYFDSTEIINSAKNLKLWIFGHIHTQTFRNIGNITFVSNPLGYYGENNFHKGIETIEVDI